MSEFAHRYVNSRFIEKTHSPCLKFRHIETFVIIWLDPTSEKSHVNAIRWINTFQCVVNNVKIFQDPNACIDFLTDLFDEYTIMIVSNEIAQWLIPLIEHFDTLHSIYVIDQDQSSPSMCLQQHPKVKGIYIEMDAVVTNIKNCIHCNISKETSISILSNNSTVNFNELNQSFMYSQLLTEIIIDISYNTTAKTDFVDSYRQQFVTNDRRLEIINDFEMNYEKHTAIWWYTKEPLIFSVINRALRNQDIELIMRMGFFVQDLHRQIEKLYKEKQYRDRIIVYRGQGLLNVDFENLKRSKSGLLAFNNFLSTSSDRDVAYAFGDSTREDPNFVGILFRIEIDPLISSVPFAELNDVSFYSNIEKEVLFSMHTIFRIGSITLIDNRFWQVELNSTNDDDQQLKLVTECMRKEIGDGTGWIRMAILMIKMGKFDKAISIYNTLITPISSQKEKELYLFLPIILNNSAVTYGSMGDYSIAHLCYETMVNVFEEWCSSNHPLLLSTYNNIGAGYLKSNDLQMARTYFEKALQQAEISQSSQDPEIVSIYEHLGHIDRSASNYSNAIILYERTLELKQKLLPKFHPFLGVTYISLAGLHDSLANYSKSLSYCEQALETEQKTLSPHHPDLATTYNMMGSINESIGQYLTYLSYYEKAFDIQQKSLSPNHPDLAITLNNIGETYRTIGNYSKALSYHQKVIDIRETSTSHNDLRFANSYSLCHSTKASTTHSSRSGGSYVDMGGLYKSMGNCSDALSFYKKALDNQQQLLEPDLRHLAITYNDLGLVYQLTGDRSTAVSYYNKTLDIQNKRLTPNHPHFLVTSQS